MVKGHLHFAFCSCSLPSVLGLGNATLQTETPPAWLSIAQIHYRPLIHFTSNSVCTIPIFFFAVVSSMTMAVTLYATSGESMYVSPLCIHSRMEILAHRACACLDPVDTAKQFSKLVVPIYISTSIVHKVWLSCKL